MSTEAFTQTGCSEVRCAESATTLLDGRPMCRKHFLAHAYRYLASVDAQIADAEFHEGRGELAGRLLEEYMRHAADIACAPVAPGNLERAQVLDVLLWASELHGRLRRSPRVRARIPILVRCESLDKPWEEKTETELLSRHGFQFTCRHELEIHQTLLCVRLDKGCQIEARVVWTRRKASGEITAGLEFLADENFWTLETDAREPAAPRS